MTGAEAGALTVAGQWRNFTAFPSILANLFIINRLIFTSGLRRVNSTNLVPQNERELVASKVVPLVWYCKTPAGWKRLPVAMSGNGKIRPRFAQMVKGQVWNTQKSIERCAAKWGASAYGATTGTMTTVLLKAILGPVI
jgi:hypothetical protein